MSPRGSCSPATGVHPVISRGAFLSGLRPLVPQGLRRCRRRAVRSGHWESKHQGRYPRRETTGWMHPPRSRSRQIRCGLVSCTGGVQRRPAPVLRGWRPSARSSFDPPPSQVRERMGGPKPKRSRWPGVLDPAADDHRGGWDPDRPEVAAERTSQQSCVRRLLRARGEVAAGITRDRPQNLPRASHPFPRTVRTTRTSYPVRRALQHRRESSVCIRT